MSKKNKPGKLVWHILVLATIIVVFAYGVKSTFKKMYPLKYKEEIVSAALKYDVEPEIIFALVKAESSFKPDAKSHAGALGLTQITEETFDWIKWKRGDISDITYKDILNPEVALDYGVYLLKAHLDEFGSLDNALSAYNAGRTTLKNWLKDDNFSKEINGIRVVNNIPYKETANYVAKINRSIKIYSKLYDI